MKESNAAVQYSKDEDWKSIAISSTITFISAFIVAVAAMPIDPENFTRAAVVSLLLTWARAGLKGVFQYLILKFK